MIYFTTFPNALHFFFFYIYSNMTQQNVKTGTIIAHTCTTFLWQKISVSSHIEAQSPFLQV